jgi:hypothetical protein
MGRPDERCHRAHRKGVATRALIINLLQEKGLKVDMHLENALVHWGGWSSKGGIQTMKDVYVSTCLDEHLDVFGLAYNMQHGRSMQEARVQEFMGHELFPEGGVRVEHSIASKRTIGHGLCA